MVDCGPRFAILYWTVYYQCKIPVSGKSEPIILKKLDLFSWKFHEIHTQRSLIMRAQKLLYVFARRYQMISACMTVSVRELRTAAREWACCSCAPGIQTMTPILLSSGPQISMHNWKLFFLFLNQNICCGYSKEPSRWDGSFEHPKHMFELMDKKIIAILR